MCIHRMNIVHRDLKSANCLVNRHWTVKICDFGLSRIMTDSTVKDSSSAGTPEWMAPELIRNEPFTDKCDIFSLGVIMWEFCTLNRPWEGVTPDKVNIAAYCSYVYWLNLLIHTAIRRAFFFFCYDVIVWTILYSSWKLGVCQVFAKKKALDHLRLASNWLFPFNREVFNSGFCQWVKL